MSSPAVIPPACRWAAWPRPTTSLAPRCSWPPMPRATSPDRTSSSTADLARGERALASFPAAINHDIVADIAPNDRAGTDDTAAAYPDALDNDCASPNVRLLADADPTAQHRARRHMAVVADDAIMVDRRARVDDGIGT